MERVCTIPSILLGGDGMDGLGFGTANHHGLGRVSSYCSLAMEQLSGPDFVGQSAFRDAVWTDLAQNVYEPAPLKPPVPRNELRKVDRDL